MLNFYTSDRFFLHAAGAVLAFRLLGSHATVWLRQLLLIGISIYFLSLLEVKGIIEPPNVQTEMVSLLERIGPLLALYLTGVLALGYCLRRVTDRLRTVVLATGCIVVVGLLALYKYGGGLAARGWLPAVPAYLVGLEWIGLSYVTFKVIDYFATPATAAPERGTSEWPFLLSYLLFFPAYISGPIYRFQGFVSDQSRPLTRMSWSRTRANLMRASLGVIKILLLGRWAFGNSIACDGFRNLASLDVLSLALSLYAFYLYFYFDFSGYCDIAIALADFFDVRLPENFRYPFVASSPQDFWNRWHISLSVWIRDFVFFRIFRLLAQRFPMVPHFLAMMTSSFIALALVGAWHGDSLNWLLYGCYHGTALCLHLLYRHVLDEYFPNLAMRLDDSPLYRAVCVVLTFNYAAWGLLLTIPLANLGILLRTLL